MIFHVMVAFGVCFSTSSSWLIIKDVPIVRVNEGTLRGSVKRLLDGTSYYSFKGIQYAQPPVGELRFKSPLPPKPWRGIRNAFDHGSVCPQYDTMASHLFVGNEDCLYLNVYTKSLRKNSKIPVMVFIHGGSFMYGSGDALVYGPEFLLIHDVILVTLNYRLEVLGFLSLDTPEVPGNAGMKDQVMALKWVKKNIAKFGGDPDNITLFGESAGSASVTYHMISRMSEGLFHKAIGQSGTAFNDWAIETRPVVLAFRVGNLLGKDTKNKDELLTFLRSLPAVDLANLTMKINTKCENLRESLHFVPVVEKKFDNVDSFINEDPVYAVSSKKGNKVPLILGYNSAEGLLILEYQLRSAKFRNKCPSYFVPNEITKNLGVNQLNEFGHRIKRFYFGNRDISNNTAVKIVNMQTDVHFGYNTHRYIEFYKGETAPVYKYRFNYDTDLNIVKKSIGLANMKGACHGDDIYYLFFNKFNKHYYNEEAKLRDIVYKVTKLWTNFAKSGNPTPDNSLDVTWKPYTKSKKEYIKLNNRLSTGYYADRKRVEFWDKLYCEAGRPSIHKFHCKCSKIN